MNIIIQYVQNDRDIYQCTRIHKKKEEKRHEGVVPAVSMYQWYCYGISTQSIYTIFSPIYFDYT